MFSFRKSTKKDKKGVPCHIGYLTTNIGELYSCYFENQQDINNHIEQIEPGPITLYDLRGPLLDNNAVKKVQFKSCKLTRVPSGLKKLFPNFKHLIIYDSDIRTITKYDLDEYKDLITFTCSNCKLEYLLGDLFNNFDNIEHIAFTFNNITFIEPNIFDGLNNLKDVSFDFNYNPNYYISYSNHHSDAVFSTLEELKSYLNAKLIERYEPLTDLENQVEQLKKDNNSYLKDTENQEHVNNSLKHEIAGLETKVENLRTENKQLRIFGERQKQEVKESKAVKAKIDQEVKVLKEAQSKLTQQVQKLKNSESKLNSENNQLKNSKSKIEQQLQQSKNSEKKLNLQIEQLKTINKNLTQKNQQLEKMKATLAYDLASFTRNDTTKDFKIIIDSREFPVHKFLLAARSPTLAEILKNNPEVENLNLVDISVEIFEKILKFLYTDELPGDDRTNFLHLFAAAGKLKITKLVEHAAGNLVDRVDSENALEILKLSASFNLHDLKLKAFKLLKIKYRDIKFEDEWLENPEKLIKVTEMLKKKEEMLKKFEEEFKEVAAIK